MAGAMRCKSIAPICCHTASHANEECEMENAFCQKAKTILRLHNNIQLCGNLIIASMPEQCKKKLPYFDGETLVCRQPATRSPPSVWAEGGDRVISIGFLYLYQAAGELWGRPASGVPPTMVS